MAGSIGDVLANLLAAVGAVVDDVVAVGAAERNAAASDGQAKDNTHDPLLARALGLG